MHVVYPAVLASLLFSVGVYGVLARRNAILVLMSVELMLNAVNINLVAFDVWLADRLGSGQVLALFVIVVAAAEVGLGLAIVLQVFRNRATVSVDALTDLNERTDSEEMADGPDRLADAEAIKQTVAVGAGPGSLDPPTAPPSATAPAASPDSSPEAAPSPDEERS